MRMEGLISEFPYLMNHTVEALYTVLPGSRSVRQNELTGFKEKIIAYCRTWRKEGQRILISYRACPIRREAG
jgi:hypothetical protein